MTHRPRFLSALLIGTALLTSACSIAPPMNPQETQIKTDLESDRFLPATREMRDAIETQELFAQAAFWSNEYHLNPSDLESAIKLAASVRKLGNPGRAVEITQTTRALYPRDPYLMAEYAAALIASERSQEALPILSTGLNTTPNYGRLWSLKGAALDQQERYAEARQHYDRALRITPNDPNVMANLGLSHALAGDAATAEVWLRRAASMPNASNSVRQNLSLVLQLQGKNGEADKLNRQFRPEQKFPQMRPAHNPAPSAQQPVQQQVQQRTSGFQQAPKARLQTGPVQGQTYKSASEAARAMAQKRSQQTPPQATQPNTAPNGYPPQSYGAPRAPQTAGTPQNHSPDRRTPNRRRR